MTVESTKQIVFIMGVSGSGKTTVGRRLADELSVRFIDGDDYHPPSNIEKMSHGIPLNDADRQPWLSKLNELAKSQMSSGCVIACSALKEIYRVQLIESIDTHLIWVYLKGDYDQVFERMKGRKDHFMDTEMLRSQFEILEEPSNAIEVDINNTIEVIVQKIKLHSMNTEIGVIGLGVMGKSLCRNLARNGFNISMYNRRVDGVEVDIAKNCKSTYQELEHALPFDDLGAFVQSLETPRKIILMVNAGPTVDAVLEDLSDWLEEGDILIDGGNSYYEDTRRRIVAMKEQGLVFVGTGISGGEEGALKGPSIMPSGEKEAYSRIQKYLESIAARDEDGNPCCTYVGNQGSGHFVKMIHNGIEYAEMQLLAECYAILRRQGMSNDEIATTLEAWMEDLGSYLLEITIDILRKKEGEDYLLDKILDKAGNKGTGSWATAMIAGSGEPATMIPAALFARYLSFFKEKRGEVSQIFNSPPKGDAVSAVELKSAYEFSRIINHHQGFSIIAQASQQNGWDIDLSEIARIWTAGCIIKSDFMKDLVDYLKVSDSILLNDKLIQLIKQNHASIQTVVAKCIGREIHIPCFMDAVNFFHGIKTVDSPANLIQAQRDYFGAHTYQRVDDPTGNRYHSEWKAS